MIIDNVRVINKDRLPPNIKLNAVFTPEAYHYMLARREENPCLLFDVTVQKGDKEPLACERFVHEFMLTKFPDVKYHFERSIDAFNGMLNNLNRQDGNSLVKTNDGKSFVYYYIYSEDREAIGKLAKFVSSKNFMNKVEKVLQGE